MPAMLDASAATRAPDPGPPLPPGPPPPPLPPPPPPLAAPGSGSEDAMDVVMIELSEPVVECGRPDNFSLSGSGYRIRVRWFVGIIGRNEREGVARCGLVRDRTGADQVFLRIRQYIVGARVSLSRTLKRRLRLWLSAGVCVCGMHLNLAALCN